MVTIKKQLKTSKIMKLINELGLDLESVEVREKIVDFLMGVSVEFKHLTLDSIDCRGRIMGYRNRRGQPDFCRIMLAVWDDFPAGWRQLDEFDTVIFGRDLETKKVLVHISDILISDILADTLVMFVKGKTISGPKVFKDWKVSMSYLSNSNGFKY